MRKIVKKTMGIVMAMSLMALGLTGCGSTNNDGQTTGAPAETPGVETPVAEGNTELSGSITMSGSTSMEKLANAVAESFMEKYPNVTVSAEFTGSSAGIESVLAGSVDIGNASRELKDSEKEAGVVGNVVAIDGIAIIVNPATTVTDLTKEQLTKIYTGEITNWKDLGGEDAPIVVVGREAGSGTRGAFEEILDVADKCNYTGGEIESTGAVMAKVASTPGSIGYVSLDVLDDTVTAVKLEGVEANAENIKSGAYFLSRPFIMATVGEVSEQNENVKALFDYLASEEGKQLIEAVGLITVD